MLGRITEGPSHHEQNCVAFICDPESLVMSVHARSNRRSGHGTGAEVGAMLARVLPLIRTVVRRFRVPITASVSDAAVTVKWADGGKLRRVVRYAVKRSSGA